MFTCRADVRCHWCCFLDRIWHRTLQTGLDMLLKLGIRNLYVMVRCKKQDIDPKLHRPLPEQNPVYGQWADGSIAWLLSPCKAWAQPYCHGISQAAEL